MKHLIFKHAVLVFAGILFSAGHMYGQSGNNVDKKLEFNGEKTEKTIPVDVVKGAKSLSAVIEGEIDNGSLYVTMYDPEGNRVNGFSLVSGDENGTYHIKTQSGESVFNMDDNGGNHSVVISSGKGSSTVTTISGSEGKSSYTISVDDDKDKNKEKVKDKDKDKEKNKTIHIRQDDHSPSAVEIITSDGQGAKGVYVESIEDPMPGVWKFVVESDGAVGKLKVLIEID